MRTERCWTSQCPLTSGKRCAWLTCAQNGKSNVMCYVLRNVTPTVGATLEWNSPDFRSTSGESRLRQRIGTRTGFHQGGPSVRFRKGLRLGYHLLLVPALLQGLCPEQTNFAENVCKLLQSREKCRRGPGSPRG